MTDISHHIGFISTRFAGADGFLVVDYRKVDSTFGDWEELSAMQDHFRLMFDGVINHISQK